MCSWLHSLLTLLVISSSVHCAKILAVFPAGAPSHYILGSSLLRALAEKGHDVTMISPFQEKSPPKQGSYRDIVLTGFREEHEKTVKEMNPFEFEKKNVLTLLPKFFRMFVEQSEQVLNHTNVRKLINSDEKFDVVIVEQFVNEAHKAFASYFDAPLIVLSTIGASSWINPLVGNPSPLSYISDPLLGFSSDMTFTQKCINTLMYLFQIGMNHFYMFPEHDQLVKKYISSDLNLNDIMYNISLVLLNSHPTLNQPVPYVPNMIDIGGYHVRPPKELPKDLKSFLDNSPEGVIYFSLGSNVKSAYLPEAKRNEILQAFSKLKQKVLWKWEEDVLPGQPPNVRLGKWLPQQDILAHPNVKLFVTHSGLLSTIETVYHGVPVLAIPIGGDQKLNAQQVVKQGFGLQLSFDELTEKSLRDKITELLTNPKYTKNAKVKSQLFHDRIADPLDTAIYWVEYIIRHRGAPHLKVAGVDLPWYKYFLIDVILVILTVVLITMYVSTRVCKRLLSVCCSSKKQKIKVN